MIGIIDYGMGNIKSVANGIISAGGAVKVVSDPAEIRDCSSLVLPGVGAFRQAMENLSSAKFIDPIKGSVRDGMPILGVCLGMQLLAESSEEFGVTKGLGLVEGDVVAIPPSVDMRLPHMGWNEVEKTCRADNHLFNGVPDNGCFYFVHSFMLQTKEEYLSSVTFHGSRISASLQVGNIFATQFHPEKSQTNGARLLENFVGISNNYRVNKDNG
jgi:imidazole glycerol-phosphate synthase subunit HisH